MGVGVPAVAAGVRPIVSRSREVDMRFSIRLDFNIT
jgi:hypothetical protein